MHDEQSIIMNTNVIEISSNDHTLQTVTSGFEIKLGKAIANCIEVTKEVQQLDTLRKDLKILKHSHLPQDNEDYQKYRCLLSKLKAKVTALYREHCMSLKKHEKEFYMTHGRYMTMDVSLTQKKIPRLDLFDIKKRLC